MNRPSRSFTVRRTRLIALLGLSFVVFAGVAFGAKSSFKFDRSSQPVGGSPVDVASADFDGDGRLDLAVTDFASGLNEDTALTILKGAKGGKFKTDATIQLPTSQPDGIAVARVDKGKDWDLVIAAPFGSGNGAVVLLGGSGMSFSAPEIHPIPTEPVHVATGDFNRDKRTDIVTSDLDTGGISVLLATSGGGFAPPVSYPGPDQNAGQVIVAKLNGDKIPDAAVTYPGSSKLLFFYGRKDGTFKPFKSVKVGIGATALTVGDLNGDGRPDLAAAGLKAGAQVPTRVAMRGGPGPDVPSAAAVLIAKKGGFKKAKVFQLGRAGEARAVEVGRFDDGDQPDLAISFNAKNQVAFVPGGAHGRLEKPTFVDAGSTPEGLAMGNFDDGRTLDLAVVNSESNKLSVLLGR